MNFARINDYPYVIHPCGTILRLWSKSIRNPKGCSREMKSRKEKSGYMRIELSKNGKKNKFQIHRLLALAFIPNPENKPYIDHINGIKDDNRLENLRWVTHQENMNGFRSNPAQIITKGCIRKTKYSFEWSFCMSGKRKTKTMKNKTDLEKFRFEKLAEYNISL